MQISIEKLKALADLLLSHVEESGSKTIEIGDDYYWDVPESARYNPSDKPIDLTIGQLSDDVSELRRMLAGDTPVLGYGLVWLSAVLRRVGETSVG